MVHRRSVAFVAMLGLLPFVLVACSKATSSADPRTQAPLVQVGTVEISTRAERSFTGIVAARVQSDLGFRVPGKILERLVDTGQTVKRGQPLMRIDPTDLRLATRAHEEAVAAAMNDLAAARKRPEFQAVTVNFSPAVPQIFVDVDKDKVLKQGVAPADVYQTLQAFLGASLLRLGIPLIYGIDTVHGLGYRWMESEKS